MNRPPVNKSKIKKNLLGIAPGNAPKKEVGKEEEEANRNKMKHPQKGNGAVHHYFTYITHCMQSICEFTMYKLFFIAYMKE